ncbi:ImmA/IrrE family metallo-endopeptidase [Aerococcaceae bacterium zg-B36]|uniref:ImmA/IrrE family metallo-endopeptidase n=1 Tax=Aerococcaceae bacterium zg-252 TaxID=2796928 RepID=UPI001BD8F845|nr:ImmA/IrrE family metallo-endopeptidase [Aerococcaceae bacterium zg-B36]
MKDFVDKICIKFDTANPYLIAERAGIAIIPTPLAEENYGFRLSSGRSTSILINEATEENLQLFTLAHELGHCFLHKDINTAFFRKINVGTKIIKIEAEANTFAFALLKNYMPYLQHTNEDEILKYFNLPYNLKPYINKC